MVLTYIHKFFDIPHSWRWNLFLPIPPLTVAWIHGSLLLSRIWEGGNGNFTVDKPVAVIEVNIIGSK